MEPAVFSIAATALWALCAVGVAWYLADIAKDVTYVTLADGRRQERSIPVSGFFQLPIEPFLKFIPKSLLQQHTPENEEKVTKLFLKMAELYKKYIEKKRSQVK